MSSLPAASSPRAMPGTGRWPGLVLAAAVAAVGIGLGHVGALQALGLGPLTLAIAVGLVAGNLLPPALAGACAPGIALSKQTLLRLGVVLYALRLTLADIGHMGWAGVAIDALVLASTFAIAAWAGPRWFGLEPETAALIGAGSSICGAAAVMATEPVVRARADQVSVAVATVVLFGTLATFAYPVLFHLAVRVHLLADTPRALGQYAGSTIHELAQVVAAARAAGPEAADAAVVAKMVRVMMLAPFLLLLSLRRAGPRAGVGRTPAVPGFALAFVVVVGLHSLWPLPAAWRPLADALTTFLLSMAMGALGAATRLASLRRAGGGAMALAALLFAWLVLGGGAINHWLGGAP